MTAAERRRTWWIVLALSLGTGVSNGFARFAYGLILPAMQADLGWNFTQAGWINTANAIGYLAGALIGLFTVSWLGPRRLFVWGMALTTLALAFSATTRDIWLLSAWRMLAGIGGAPVFIAGGAMASALFAGDRLRNALAIAVFFGGGGFGMLLTGVSLPFFMDWFGDPGWPLAWLMLGIASYVAFVASFRAAEAAPEARPVPGAKTGGLPVLAMLPALSAYFLFGLTYIVYVTFLAAWIRGQGGGVTLIALSWSLLSLAVMAGPFVWRNMLARSEGGGAMALTSLLTGIAMLMPVAWPGDAMVIASAILFGVAFFMVPTSAANFCRKNLAHERWGAAIALMTVVFAAGQIIGPVAAGALADRAGSTDSSLVWAGGILIAGALIALVQRPLGRA